MRIYVHVQLLDNFLQMDMKCNGTRWQQMTAVAVVAVTGTACCTARLHGSECSLYSKAFSKWASCACCRPSWPFVGSVWMGMSCLLLLLHTNTLTNYFGQSQKAGQQGELGYFLYSFSSQPALGLELRVRVREDKLLYFMSACMLSFVGIRIWACVYARLFSHFFALTV